MTATLTPSADDERWAPNHRSRPEDGGDDAGYLDQISVSLRPRSVDAADNALRCLATYLTTETRVVRGRARMRCGSSRPGGSTSRRTTRP